MSNTKRDWIDLATKDLKGLHPFVRWNLNAYSGCTLRQRIALFAPR